ncbi:hypothetical protein FBU59_003783, partial [Linderina macrospora]
MSITKLSVDAVYTKRPAAQNSGTTSVVLDIDRQLTSENEFEAEATMKCPSREDITSKLAISAVAAINSVDDDVATYTLTKKQLISAIGSLGLLMFISALDATVMGSIYVPIASDFDALDKAVWIITTYNLSSTVVQAVIGKVSDILGRIETALASIFIFLVGSVLCGASQSMNMLIASRTIQGVGGGGITGLDMVILGDLFSERERGKYIGIFSTITGLAMVVGPVMGGGIVEHASWRIVFWINIPIC